MISQNLLNNLKSQLTPEEIEQLREQFAGEMPAAKYRWHRLWKVSPKRGRVNIGLIRAAKDLIKNRHAAETLQINKIIAEVELILQEESQYDSL